MEKITFNRENFKKELKNRSASQKKGIHNYSQEIVRQICEYFGSYKEFSLWCGVAKRIGPNELKNRFDYIKERKITNSRYLLASCK